MEEYKGFRRKPKREGAAGSSDLPEPPARFGYWELWAFLAHLRWEDGSGRIPGTIILFVDDGRLKACLNDRDGCAVAFVTVPEEEHVLEYLNLVLRSDGAEWRSARGKGRK